MRRTLNLKLLICVVAATAVMGGGVHFVHGFQENRNAGVLLKRADQAERKGDLAEIEKYLSRYLILRPGDADALARYAQIMDKRDTTGRNRVRVLLALDETLRRGGSRDNALLRGARLRAAELAMTPELARYREAREHLDVLLRLSPGSGKIEQLIGQCVEAEGKSGDVKHAVRRYDEARTWYEKSITDDASQIAAYDRLAALFRNHLGDPAAADRIMDRLIAGDVKAPRPSGLQAQAYLTRAHYREAHRLDGAADDVSQALKLAPDDADVLVAAAERARRGNDLAEARKLSERGVKLYPKDDRMYQSLASVEAMSGRPEEAVKVLERGFVSLPAKDNLLWNQTELLVQMKRTDEARAAIAQLRKKDNVFQPVVDLLEARLLLDEGRRAEAVPLLERTRALMSAVPALGELVKQADLLLAENYEQLGNPDRQLAACRRVLERDGPSLPARFYQAKALLTLGRNEEALAAYAQLAPAIPAAHLTVAELMLDRLLRLPEEKRQWLVLDKVLDEAERALPDSVEVLILRADVLMERREYDRARGMLEQARTKAPEKVEPWLALARLTARRGRKNRSWKFSTRLRVGWVTGWSCVWHVRATGASAAASRRIRR